MVNTAYLMVNYTYQKKKVFFKSEPHDNGNIQCKYIVGRSFIVWLTKNMKIKHKQTRAQLAFHFRYLLRGQYKGVFFFVTTTSFLRLN